MRRKTAALASLVSAASCSCLRVAPSMLAMGANTPAIGLRSSAVMSTVAFNPDKYFTVQPPTETKGYIMQQTMVRVKDPEVSLRFYCEVLGFNLVMYRDFPQYEFTVYFVAQVDPALIPATPEEQWKFCMTTPGCIELTHNYGSETADGLVYNTGNSDTTGSQDGQKVKGGFGHLGITVPDVYEACERFKALGCEFTKTPNSGGMKGLAFIKDPDGYLIEILPQGNMITKPTDCAGVAAEGGEGYKDNSK